MRDFPSTGKALLHYKGRNPQSMPEDSRRYYLDTPSYTGSAYQRILMEGLP
ncbi:MAG: hypothetical protein ACRCZM_04225 [Bacteroidales bacterium]